MGKTSFFCFMRKIAIAGLILAIGTVIAFQAPGTRFAQAASAEPVIRYPAKNFEGGKAQFYRYRTPEGITIRYFILKSSDGVIRAAFDACDVCWTAGKGYSQKGNFMVCNNCGMRIPSVRINEVKGGCNPHPLNRQVADGQVAVRVSDLLEGSRYFEFEKKGKK